MTSNAQNTLIQRTFSVRSSQLNENNHRTLDLLFNANKSFSHEHSSNTWETLNEQPFLIITGEAGIGKTTLFEEETQRLKQAGQHAFYIPLNRLKLLEDWELSLNQTDYQTWLQSSEKGYFFFDAIDEARLYGSTHLTKAIQIIINKLQTNFSRIYLRFSTRPMDWAIDSIQQAIHKTLYQPLMKAHSAQTPDRTIDQATNDLSPPENKPYVYTLDPFTRNQAKKYIDNQLDASSATNLLWQTIEKEGLYHLAATPFNLNLLINTWLKHQKFISYQSILHENICNFLEEKNPIHRQSSHSAPTDTIWQDISLIAACMIQTEKQYITHSIVHPKLGDHADILEILSEKPPAVIDSLLNCAIFEEVSTGVFKFRHRIFHEYLAASWFDRKLKQGTPLSHIKNIFASSQYNGLVLKPKWQATLAWLATLNIHVREWVANDFPEIFAFDGDQSQWEVDFAEKAFKKYLVKYVNGYYRDWHGDRFSSATYYRIGKVLENYIQTQMRALTQTNANNPTPTLSNDSNSNTSTPILPNSEDFLPYIRHAQLNSCVNEVFSLYERHKPERLGLYALSTLQGLTLTSTQQTSIQEDILTRKITQQAHLTRAFGLLNHTQLNLETCKTLFEYIQTSWERDYSSIDSAWPSFASEILHKAELATCNIFLSAILSTLDEPLLSHQDQADEPSERLNWYIELLSLCMKQTLTRIIQARGPEETLYQEILKNLSKASECIEIYEKNGSKGYLDRRALNALPALIRQNPAFRKYITLAVYQSPHRSKMRSMYLLVNDPHSLVSYQENDLENLLDLATNRPEQEKKVWLEMMCEILFRHTDGKLSVKRKAWLKKLKQSDQLDWATCKADFNMRYTKLHHRRSQQKQFNQREHRSQEMRESKAQTNRENLLADIDKIHNGTAEGALQFLGQFTLEKIEEQFGKNIHDAFISGIKAYWRNITPSHPLLENAEPHHLISIKARMAGIQYTFEDINSTQLSNKDITRAAQLAIWQIQALPRLKQIISQHTNLACEALSPWLTAEINATSPDASLYPVFDFMLYRDDYCDTALRLALFNTIIDKINSTPINNLHLIKEIPKLLNKIEPNKTFLTADTLEKICNYQLNALSGDITSKVQSFITKISARPIDKQSLLTETGRLLQNITQSEHPLPPKSTTTKISDYLLKALSTPSMFQSIIDNKSIHSKYLLNQMAQFLQNIAPSEHPLPEENIKNICHDLLNALLDKIVSMHEQAQEHVSAWFKLYMKSNISSAWQWWETQFEERSKITKIRQHFLLTLLAKVFSDTAWFIHPANSNNQEDNTNKANTLLAIFKKIKTTFSDECSDQSFKQALPSNLKHIIELLQTIRGRASYNALGQCIQQHNELYPQPPLNQEAILFTFQTHEAGYASQNDALAALKTLGDGFGCAPTSADILYHQVLTRLKDIRTMIEQGPFSDRDLFTQGMPEKNLQRWLAAKLFDTPHKYFSVSREEEVDNDKKTDIQLAYQSWKICIEIKPVDVARKYTANSLNKETLSDQTAGQYLKGHNSHHGILVLFRLDHKKWEIPQDDQESDPTQSTKPKFKDFSELCKYLQTEANGIKSKDPTIQQLTVFGIDCVDPKNTENAEKTESKSSQEPKQAAATKP